MTHNKTHKNLKLKKQWPASLFLYSSPSKAQSQAYKYLGKTARLYPSTKKDKKYSIYDKKNNNWVSFGQLGYEDYTKHHNKTRRKNYLTRSGRIKGDWKKNRYSSNNLARRILW
jgi:Family of unknown function (DUF5754)